jgi:Protein of unknown function (DUF4232)
MRPLALTLLAALALTMSACGSSRQRTSTGAAPPSTSPVTSTTGTATSTVSRTTTAPTITTSTTGPVVAAGVCRASGLRLSFLGQQGATGHGELGFVLKNTTASSCHTFGYPGILFLSASGGSLPTDSTRTTHDFFGSTPEQPLQIAPGESFSFRIGVTHFGPGGSNTGCTTAAALQVIAPNDTATMRITIPQGAYECGTATVSPVRPGDSAYP